MTGEHIGELAELYALGALDDAERAKVDAHTRSCTLCAQRLGEAERFIAETIGEHEPSPALDRRVRAALAPPRRTVAPRWGALVAAAFVLGLLPGMLFAVFYHPATPFDRDRDRAIAALIHSHFTHAQFTPLAPDAPKAKVLYGHGSPWRFFIAQSSRAYTVEMQTPTGGRVLGTLHVSGDAGELFIADAGGRTFVLLDGTRPVARVTLP